MQALKGLVISLAVLIAVGMALVAYGLYRQASEPGLRLFGGSERSGGASPPKAFGEIALSLPAGCTIVEARPEGERLFLRIGPPGPACERVIVVDIAGGTVLGTVAVRP